MNLFRSGSTLDSCDGIWLAIIHEFLHIFNFDGSDNDQPIASLNIISNSFPNLT